jgi:hypothetical protein
VHCFACGAPIEIAAGERVGFHDDCPSCRASLHACRNCAHHDPAAHNQCREPNAEWVADRERGNRCEYFTPGTGAGGHARGSRERAKNALDALFGKK